MTNIEFKINQITEDDISEVPSPHVIPVLEETSFLVPTRLILNGVNVFQYNSGNGELVEWLALPAFGILRDWKSIIPSLQDRHDNVLKLAGYGQIAITQRSQLITCSCNFGHNSGVDTYPEFLAGIVSGLTTLRKELSERYPDIVRHLNTM